MTVKLRPYRRGGWEVDISLAWPDGTKYRERRRAPVSAKSAALHWAVERETLLLRLGPAALAAGRPADKREEVPTLGEFAPRFIEGFCRANRHKPSGIDTKERLLKHHLLPKLKSKRLDEITNEEIQRLKARLGAYNAKTVNNVLSTLSRLLKTAVEWGVLPVMPCRIGLLKVVHRELGFYEPEAYVRLVDGAKKVDARIHALALLGGDAGLRRGEMIGLKWTDVDFARRQLRVQRGVWKGIESTTKGARPRIVPMTQELAAVLLELRHLRGPNVLCQDDGRPVTENILGRWIERAAQRAGLEPKRALHILRHTFCSHLSSEGAPAKAIQELAGHASLSTTLGYMHLSPSSRQQAIELLDEAHRQARWRRDSAIESTRVDKIDGDMLETAVGDDRVSNDVV